MNRAGGRVSRGEPAGTQCRGFTRSGIRHWGGFEDNGSCVAAGFASFMPAVRRARLNLRGTIPPAQSRQREAACLDSMPASVARGAWRQGVEHPCKFPPRVRTVSHRGKPAARQRGESCPLARFPRDPRKPISPASRAAASFPRRHPRAVTVERRGRVDWHGDNRARRGVIRARVKRKARRAGLSQTGDGVPVQGR